HTSVLCSATEKKYNKTYTLDCLTCSAFFISIPRPSAEPVIRALIMKALVTGANGHIGSNLVRALAERGYSVRATVRSIGEAGRTAVLTALPEVEVVELDIRDADRFRSLCDQIDVLFHVATT